MTVKTNTTKAEIAKRSSLRRMRELTAEDLQNVAGDGDNEQDVNLQTRAPSKRRLAERVVAIAVGATLTAAGVAVSATGAGAALIPPTISVQGNLLVDGNGVAVQLRGVNRAAFESRCTWDISGGVADGPVDQASVTAMLSWNINTVRLPLNEDCWLGINGLPMGGTAASYQAAVSGYVNLLRANGLYVMPELHMTAPGVQQSTQIDYLPDADHAIDFWASVAGTFAGDHGIIFDPINEVRLASWNNPNPNPPGQWDCWLNGCQLDSIYAGAPRYMAAGLQTLVNTIRTAGATQPIVLGGLSFNSDLSQLLSKLPTNPVTQLPDTQLIASAHVYDFVFPTFADIDAMFTNQLIPISAQIPVILGELGEINCDAPPVAFTNHLLGLVSATEANGTPIGVLGWTWNARTADSTGWQCPTGPFGDGGPLLIRDYAGTPTVMGDAIRTWIIAHP